MAQDDVHMADGTKDTEIKMNMPKPFTGKREELKRFMQNCKIYLQINKKKWKTGKELYAHIRTLSKDLDEEEYKVLMEESETSGF